jgi:hypothetical protein
MIDVYQGLFNVKTKNLQIINNFPDPTCRLITYIIMCKNQRINLSSIYLSISLSSFIPFSDTVPIKCIRINSIPYTFLSE